MGYEVTATKFRPQTFDELIGQDFVASTLRNSIEAGRIANAYLLSGPRGVGKTSAARIIAKALNCINGPTGKPCNVCENCKSITTGSNSDVIEIDGASNTGVNDIRAIQEEIMYPPVGSTYKVYIIDEVHMLSKGAFNALLKTIEEPPPRVVFVFATTEPNKVLPTIRSRCQQFNLRLIPSDHIYISLEKVVQRYAVNCEKDALVWISMEGRGSMRDSYTLLDQVISFCDGDITLKKIREKLGLVGEEEMSHIVRSIISNDRETLFKKYFFLLENGVSCEQIITELLKFFRNIMIIKSNLGKNKFVGFNHQLYPAEIVDSFSFDDIDNIIEILFKTYERTRYSFDLQTELEVCILKLLRFKEYIRPKEIINIAGSLQNQLLGSGRVISKGGVIPPVVEQSRKVFDENKSIDRGNTDLISLLKRKLSENQGHSQLVTALSRISSFEEKDSVLTIFFESRMLYDIINMNLSVIDNELKALTGKEIKIVASLNDAAVVNNIVNNDPLDKTVKSVKEIFSGKEI